MSFAAFSFGFDDPAQVESLPDVALPSGTPASTGTDSWSLVSTGVTGGVSGSGKAALEVEGDPLELWCCGVVAVRSGGSQRFCTVPAGTCKVQAHQTSRTKPSKHNVAGRAFYIPATEKSALLVPRLDKMFLSELDLADIRRQKLSPDQWSQFFIIVQSQVETRNQENEEELYLTGTSGGDIQGIGINDLAARVGRAGDYQTPRKPVVSDTIIKLEDVKTSTLAKVRELGDDLADEELHDVMAVIGANWNKMVGAVVALEATVPSVQKQLIGLFQGLSTVVEAVEDKANALGIVLGQRGVMLDAGVTIWDAVAQSVSLGSNAEGLAKSVTEDVVSVDSHVSNLEKSFNNHVQEVVQVVGQIHGTMVLTKSGHRELLARVHALERTSGAQRGNINPTSGLSAVFSEPTTGDHTEELEDLRAELGTLRTLVHNMREHQGTSIGPVLPRDGTPALDITMFHERLQKVEMRATGDSYVTEHRVFASYDDVLNWVRGAKGREDIQLYWDIYSLLSKTRDVSFTPSDYMEGALMSERLHRNPLASLIQACMQIEMPTPFLTKRGSGTSTVAGSGVVALPTIKTFDDWNAVQTGFAPKLLRAVGTEVQGLHKMVATVVSKQDHELTSLANHLIVNARFQWQGMSAWITDFYYRLVGDGGLTAKESWSIVGASVRSIFELLSTTRATGHDAMLTDDKAVGAAHCLWTVMQTHRLLNEIMSREWDAHHCVQAVLSMHVIRNRVTPISFDGLTAKLETLTKMLDKLDGRISTLEKKK